VQSLRGDVGYGQPSGRQCAGRCAHRGPARAAACAAGRRLHPVLMPAAAAAHCSTTSALHRRRPSSGESPQMRRVDDSRSLPRCLDTASTRRRQPPPADSAAGRPPARLFTMRSGRHARNARGQAAPGLPRVLPPCTGQLTQYCSVQYTPLCPPAASICDGARRRATPRTRRATRKHRAQSQALVL
jgi:hypothetical protein